MTFPVRGFQAELPAWAARVFYACAIIHNEDNSLSRDAGPCVKSQAWCEGGYMHALLWSTHFPVLQTSWLRLCSFSQSQASEASGLRRWPVVAQGLPQIFL